MDLTPFLYTLKDKNALVAAYMPYVKNGGVFLKGVQLPMGSPVGLLLELPGDTVKFGLDGKVVWVQNNGSNVGVGVQFQDSPATEQAKVKINATLLGTDRSKLPTFTL